MPTIELLAEVQALRQKVANQKEIILQEVVEETLRMALDIRKKRAERATHMSALWKRCAKKLFIEADKSRESWLYEFNNALRLLGINAQIEAELAALKKDARMLAYHQKDEHKTGSFADCNCMFCIAARHILEATKEVE